jgi:hypothetical protein
MAMKEDVPGVSRTDGRQPIQHYSSTDSETGNALGKQDRNPSEK